MLRYLNRPEDSKAQYDPSANAQPGVERDQKVEKTDHDHDIMIIERSELEVEHSHGNGTDLSLQNNADLSHRSNKRSREEDTRHTSGMNFPDKKARSTSSHSTGTGDSPATGRYDNEPEAAPSPGIPDESDDAVQPPPDLLKALETRPITVSQLIQEVKGIYAGLVMVEKKCIEIVTQQTQNPTKLSKEQWQALIALHRTLLNEHHDFFSASHHPITEGHELRELAARYAMPARMWRHGIHAFLELLRHRLPDSLEHMLSFVYLAYSMMALLKETVPDFVETWIECLGDLARYRMAIEEADLRDREIWSNTARMWYDEAADLSPNTGRVQHHLAVLARPNIVQQLFLYSKALVAAIPFKNASESILLLFNPLDQGPASNSRYQPAELNLVCAAAVLFKRKSTAEYDLYKKNFLGSLETHIARTGPRFKVQGPEIAGALFAMLMDFGNAENKLWVKLKDHQQYLSQEPASTRDMYEEKPTKDFIRLDLDRAEAARSGYWKNDTHQSEIAPLLDVADSTNFFSTDQVTSYVGPLLYLTIFKVTSHIGNKNVVPFMYMVLAHLYSLTWVPGASIYIEKFIPWVQVAEFLNTVGRSGVSYENIESPDFAKSFGGNKRQLPEDFVMRGFMALSSCYKPGFFDQSELVDEDERLLEQPSHQTPRIERCLHAAIQLADLNGRWLIYDKVSKQFRSTDYARSFAWG